MAKQKIKLLPLTEAEVNALLIAIVLVVNSIQVMDNKDFVSALAIKSQLNPLNSVKQKLET